MTKDARRFTAFAFGALATGAIVLTLLLGAVDEASLRLALRVTGRMGFFVWLAAFVASPLRSKLLLRWRARIGLFFAGGQLVHIALIAAMVAVVPGYRPPVVVALFGGGGFAVIAAMAVTSFEAPARWIGRTWWRRIHVLGMWWIAVIYAYDFFRLDAAYLPFALPLAAAFALRVPWPRSRVIDPAR